MNTLRLWFPIIAVGASIFLTSQLITEVPSVSLQLAGDLNMASIGHVALYFCLALFIARYLRRRLMLGAMGSFILAVSLCLSIGVLDEFHQMFVTGRNAEFADLVSDLIGASLGALLTIAWTGRTEKAGKSRTQGDARKGSLPAKVAAAAAIASFVAVVAVTGAVSNSFRALAAESLASAIRIVKLYQHPEQMAEVDVRSTKTPGTDPTSAEEENLKAATESTGFLKVNGSMLGYSAQLQIGKPDVVNPAKVPGTPDKPRRTVTTVRAKAEDSRTAAAGNLGARDVKWVPRAAAVKHVKAAQRKDHTRYLARFKNELAKLEIKEVRMVRYSDVYPPKVLLQEKIQYLRDKILQISSNPPQEQVSATTQDYLDALKQKLADLEIKELHMIAYSETYYQKALLKDKIALLRTKISQSQFGAESGGRPPIAGKPAAYSQAGDGSKNNREMIRLSSLAGL